MAKPNFDADALIGQFENASAKGSAKLRESVEQATLAALRGRELTLKNIRGALEGVAGAVTKGASNNLAGLDPAGLLDRAVQGMDDALLKAVQANRSALQQFVDRGADLREKHLRKAVDDLDRFDEVLIGTVKKAAEAAGPLAAPWQQMLDKLKAGGSMAGLTASATAEDMARQVQDAIKGSRAVGLRAAQALAEGYFAMASGVLVGMTDALQPSRPAPTAAPSAATAATPARKPARKAAPRRRA